MLQDRSGWSVSDVTFHHSISILQQMVWRERIFTVAPKGRVGIAWTHVDKANLKRRKPPKIQKVTAKTNLKETKPLFTKITRRSCQNFLNRTKPSDLLKLTIGTDKDKKTIPKIMRKEQEQKKTWLSWCLNPGSLAISTPRADWLADWVSVCSNTTLGGAMCCPWCELFKTPLLQKASSWDERVSALAMKWHISSQGASRGPRNGHQACWRNNWRNIQLSTGKLVQLGHGRFCAVESVSVIKFASKPFSFSAGLTVLCQVPPECS